MHDIYIKYTSHNHKQVYMESGGSSSEHYF